MSRTLQVILGQATAARSSLQALSTTEVNRVLTQIATTIRASVDQILAANEQDVAAMDPADPTIDRLRLDVDRINAIADGLSAVATLDDPVGRTLQLATRPNGLVLEKRAVPFGTIAVIYEARPNVTVDVFALCFKTRNAAVLKGGREAQRTSEAFVAIIHQVLGTSGLPAAACTLLPADRAITAQLLVARAWIDLVIPRGSNRLIQWVREHATVPVIETGAGVCHTYIDASADVTMAERIVTNAKTRRVSVCNALDTLIVHRDRIDKLPSIVRDLAKGKVELRADERSYVALQSSYPVTLLKRSKDGDYGQEFLALRAAVKVVDSLEEALKHIADYGSKHSEAIITSDPHVAEKFIASVDAACVYHNASTAFTDGGEFGMGAEVGISTQKLHARGPMGLSELTTYKWIIRGNGQIRPR